jgi:hypothetical protein
MLTRLGEADVDAFTIMRIAGHCSVMVSQRYVHPTPETLERAFDRMEIAAIAEQEREKCETVPTEVPTVTLQEKQVIQ